MQNKVTRQTLRDMRLGEQVAVKLPNQSAIDAARVTASQMQRHLGCKISVTANYEDNVVIISKT
jgi:hypothetical protein